MHAEAMNFVEKCVGALKQSSRVLEIGSLDINGSIRHLFSECDYTGLDIVPGPGVDVVGDGTTWKPKDAVLFDLIVCCEALEHCPLAGQLCRNAWHLLRQNGLFLLTAAGEGRLPHSGVDGGPLRANERYRNVSEADLKAWLRMFSVVMIDTMNPGDIYALAIK